MVIFRTTLIFSLCSYFIDLIFVSISTFFCISLIVVQKHYYSNNLTLYTSIIVLITLLLFLKLPKKNDCLILGASNKSFDLMDLVHMLKR